MIVGAKILFFILCVCVCVKNHSGDGFGEYQNGIRPKN